MTAITGKTFITDAFYRSITIDAEVGSPVDVSISVQGTGACTGTGIEE
jgi:hypothetical protein